MGNLFYDHLIILEEITAVVGNDKKALAVVNRMLEQEILDAIFSHLPREKHEEFLAKFHAAPHNHKLLDYLTKHASVNMELVILERANKTKKKILNEIKKHTT